MEASHLITEIKGVGVKTTALFSKLHIETIKDLISYFPRGYDHYGQKEWSSHMRRQEMPPGE